MNSSGHNRNTGSGDALEILLRQASPRPVPPQRDQAIVREAVHAEWKSVTGTRRTRLNLAAFGLAATVLLAIFVLFDSLRVAGVADVQVATISKSNGAIYLLGENSELSSMNELLTVSAGQTIVTGHDAGIALAWSNGGSLRIDANSRVVLVDGDHIRLQSGQVYFDSEPSALMVGSTTSPYSEFEILTDLGLVAHRGTQFMTYVDTNQLSVSVRDGQVMIDGDYYDELITAGQRASFVGDRRPAVVNISRYGGAWNWVERISPTADIDNRTAYEFLLWVSHETGLTLQFENAAVEQVVRNEKLHGTIDVAPTRALRFWMMSLDLAWRIENGVIYISELQAAGSR
jgi:FecR-like protein